jgi:type II secretory pathway component PulK
MTGATSTTITNRVCVTNIVSVAGFISTNFSSIYSSIQQKLTTMAAGTTAPGSVIDFAIQSGITEQNFATIEPYLYGSNLVGLININTASAAVLSTIPGIGYTYAPNVVSFRQSNPSRLNSVFWLRDALASVGGTNAVLQAGPWITSRSFQFSADIAAVGRHGRGYRRVRFVYDCSSGVPMIVYRQDLTFLGWALGKKIHDQVVAGKI